MIVLNFISPNEVQMIKLFPGTDHKTWQILVLYGDHKMLWENGGKQAYSATRTQTNAEVTCIFPRELLVRFGNQATGTSQLNGAAFHKAQPETFH